MKNTTKKTTIKKVKNEEKQVSTVTIEVLSDVLIDKVYKVGQHTISDELRSQIENKSIVKKGIVVKI